MKTKVKAKNPKGPIRFSDFIRNASSTENKRVYTEVMNDAIEMQRKTMEAAKDKESVEKMKM